ncbi:MAG: MOFRL family protein, partial [Pirellulaceae bacterium]
ARDCRAGRMIALIISDVLGDPLDAIASGPTVANRTTAQDAVKILDRFGARGCGASPVVFEYLERKVAAKEESGSTACDVTNVVIGNLALAVDAAGQEAVLRGYSPAMTAATTLEGPAEEIGIHLARMARQMRGGAGPDCLITGGEPVVRLVPTERRGKGGRNQQLVLAALAEYLRDERSAGSNPSEALRFALLAGGTDGEDGPTDAAGALFDDEVLRRMSAAGLEPEDFLRRNDAYHFFEPLGGLIKTGPTHTNVCDLRVVVVER